MIRINLIPTKRKKKAKPIPMYIVLVIVLLGVGAAGFFYTGYLMNSKIKTLENKKKENAQIIAELQEKIKEVKDFEALNKLFTDRKNIIEQLRKNQSMPVKILDEMSNQIPENIWLTTMNITGNKISIDGTGFTNNDIVTFIQNLKGSKLFTNVYLHETRQKEIKKEQVYDFKISLEVKA